MNETLSGSGVPPDKKAQYVVLQQEADFALWKAREAGAEIRESHTAQAAGHGFGPSPEDLATFAELERDAEQKYRALRDFLKSYFA